MGLGPPLPTRNHMAPLKCLISKPSLSLGFVGAGSLAGRSQLVARCREKTNIVLEALIIERFSTENRPALGELKIKTKTLPQADFLVNNSWEQNQGRPRKEKRFSVWVLLTFLTTRLCLNLPGRGIVETQTSAVAQRGSDGVPEPSAW